MPCDTDLTYWLRDATSSSSGKYRRNAKAILSSIQSHWLIGDQQQCHARIFTKSHRVNWAAIALPFLEWRQGMTDIRIARNEYEQLLLEFKQVQYKSMVEIDDALSEHRQLISQEINQLTALKLSRQLEKLDEVRYRQGQIAMIDWLNAQEQRRQAELDLYQSKFNQYLNLTKIYLAFGGQT